MATATVQTLLGRIHANAMQGTSVQMTVRLALVSLIVSVMIKYVNDV